MAVQKQRRPRLILFLATALLLQGVLAAHKNNCPSSSPSLASSSKTNTNNNDNNNLDIDESFQLKAKKEHKKIAGVDLDAAAEAIEKAVGPGAMAAAKKKADKFLVDHKNKKGDKKDKGDDKKKKKKAAVAKKQKNKDDDEEEEEEEEIIEISSINNGEEEENDIPVNVEDVQDYLSDIWEDIKDLGNDAAIQKKIQSLKESDEIQTQIAHLQSLEDDNPEILDRIEKLREGLDPGVKEGIERVEKGVRKAAKQLEKRHFWHQKGVQKHEHRHEDGSETDIGDAGDDAEMKSQALAKKNRKHQHQKGDAHEKAEAVGGGQMKNNKKHDRNLNKPAKQHGQGKQGQGGHRHAKKGGTGMKKNDGKGKKHHRVAKKHAVRRKGKGATIRDGHPGTPPVAVPEPIAVPASASVPIKDNGRSPDGHRHRHHHHRKHRGDDNKGHQHPEAGNDSGPGATLPGKHHIVLFLP